MRDNPNLRRNLRTKTPQAEASGKCSTTIFLPLPSPLQIKLGGPIAVNCSGINFFNHLYFIGSSVDVAMIRSYCSTNEISVLAIIISPVNGPNS